MKYLRLLLMLLGMSVLGSAQAKFIQYSPTIKSMTVTTADASGNPVEGYCMFWSQGSTFLPYTFEAACYYGGKFQWIMATVPGTTITQEFNFVGGSIVWIISPAVDGTWNYSVSGQENLLTPVLAVGTM